MTREGRPTILVRHARDAGVWIALTLFSSCASETLPEPMFAKSVRSHCPAISSADYYYPPGFVIPDRERLDTAQRDALSRYLRTIEARSLSCGDEVTEAYRLVYAHSFGQAFIVTVATTGSEWNLAAAEFAAFHRQPPWTVTRRVSRVLSAQETLQLLGGLKEAGFWTMVPTWKEFLGQDGGTLMIEGRRRKGYRTVSRPSWPKDSFGEAGRRFVRLAGFIEP